MMDLKKILSLLSNRRRIDEMKSSANAASRKPTPLTSVNKSMQPSSTNVLRPTGATVPSSAGTAGAVGDGVLIVDQEERQALHEAKKAIDHLKSVTGIYTIHTIYHHNFFINQAIEK